MPIDAPEGTELGLEEVWTLSVPPWLFRGMEDKCSPAASPVSAQQRFR